MLPKVRYIKNSLSGNTYNDYCHWIEVQAISGGTNVALGKTVTPSQVARAPYNVSSVVTDGKLITGSVPDYYDLDLGPANIVVDLGQEYDLDSLTIWHYYPTPNDRKYYGNIVEVSSDNSNWITIFNSDVDGEYIETVDGLTLTELPAKTEEDILNKINELKSIVTGFDGKIDSMIGDLALMKTDIEEVKTEGLTVLAAINQSVTSYDGYKTERDTELDQAENNTDANKILVEDVEQKSDFTDIRNEMGTMQPKQIIVRDLVEEFKNKIENM